MTDRPQNYAIEHEDGITLLFLEGPRSKHEAESVTREIANGINRAHKEGRTFVQLAIPTICKLTITRGSKVELAATADNRVMIKLIGTPRGEGILIPGRNF